MHMITALTSPSRILPKYYSWHILGHEDSKGDMLGQQASNLNVGGHHFHIKGRPMQKDLVVIGLPKPS
jgi:hypothetical protein